MINKILTKKEKEKKTQRNQLIIGFILIGIMILSTAGYAINSESASSSGQTSAQKVDYNGITFTQGSDGYWAFQKDGNQFSSKYNPNDVSDIKVLSDFQLKDYQNQVLYIAGDDSGVLEISKNFINQVLRIQKACIDENCSENLPIKDCSKDNVIVIKEPSNGENESVYRVNKCVFIVSSLQNQTKYEDAFLFKTLKI